MTLGTDRVHRRLRIAGLVLACVAACALCFRVGAQGGSAPSQAKSTKPAAEQGVRWQDLKPAQQTLLKPLEREWAGIGAQHKQKWIEMSARFPTMQPAEQARIQERMGEWARMTPQQRSQARLNFQEAKQVPATDRQARWNAYQALSPEEKRRLAARASPSAGEGKSAARESQSKSNIVPNPALTARPKVIAPVVVQAGPGATTSPITKRPTPPVHQQTGLPKIAATPGFVDKATLLPQRGPQGAAVRSASAPKTAASQ